MRDGTDDDIRKSANNTYGKGNFKKDDNGKPTKDRWNDTFKAQAELDAHLPNEDGLRSFKIKTVDGEVVNDQQRLPGATWKKAVASPMRSQKKYPTNAARGHGRSSIQGSGGSFNKHAENLSKWDGAFRSLRIAGNWPYMWACCERALRPFARGHQCACAIQR